MSIHSVMSSERKMDASLFHKKHIVAIIDYDVSKMSKRRLKNVLRISRRYVQLTSKKRFKGILCGYINNYSDNYSLLSF